MNHRAVRVDEVIINDELARRPTPPPDLGRENRALVALAEVMADSPASVLQTLVDMALELSGAGSTGISIEETDGSKGVFRWYATAGAYAPYVGGTMPRDFSPCGTVLDRNITLLMAEPVRVYPDIAALSAPVVEVLLIPFYRGKAPIGTIWAVAHTSAKRFHAEDARLLETLSRFASAAVQTLQNLEATEAIDRQLRDARARLHSALEIGAIATWTWDISKDRLVEDPHGPRRFSVAPEDAAVRPVDSGLNAVHPDDLDEVSGIIERAVSSGANFEAEYRMVQPDGSFRWVVARGKPEYDHVGAPTRLSGITVDITERRRVAEENRRLDERRRLALDAAQLGSWNIDPVTRELASDDRFQEIFSGTIGPITYEQAFARIHDQDRERVQKAVEAALRPDNPAPFAAEYRVVHPNGTVVWVLGKGRARFAGADGNRRLTSFDGTIADITERKQSEDATRRRAFHLQKLADIANRINSAHDVNSVLGVVTEEARALLDVHQAVTSMVLNPQHPQPINVVSNSVKYPHGSVSPNIDALRFYDAINQANEPIRLTQTEVESDPRWKTLAPIAGFATSINGWLAAPLMGRNSRPMGLIQLSDKIEGDFTADDEAILVQLSQLTAIAIENARLYQELRANDERKDEFLAMLAHELRNPLAAIGNAVKLTTKTDAREQLEWSMEVITRQMQHLSRLIDDLMDVSRITRGKIELRRDILEATAILESAAATVGTLIEERKHTLETAIERGNLWVEGDPTRLEQVVVNLLNNAAKYSDNAGHILLSARVEDGHVVISVKDRGVGIPSERLPEMFELFAQGDRSLARSEGGLGIGLTVVKKLVEMHGGSIIARSEGPGQGSEFIVRLPAVRKPANAQQGNVAQPEQPVKKVRILVVDDSVDTARGMARLLKLIGHEVTTAHNGPEAIELAKECRPDFVLLDIGLPGMSGYEVASQLRQEQCGKKTVIVAVSGYGQDEDRRRSKNAGFDFHLTKPLDHDALLTLLAVGHG
jgi:PAS domain S-box-containing protein